MHTLAKKKLYFLAINGLGLPLFDVYLPSVVMFANLDNVGRDKKKLKITNVNLNAVNGRTNSA